MENKEVQLIKLEGAKRAIAEAKTLDEIKNILDTAIALKAWTKAAKMGIDLQNEVAEIKIEAERKAGILLKEMEKNKGGRPKKNPSHDGRSKLKDLGIDYHQSERWQMESDVPQEIVTEYIQGKKNKKEEVTSAGLINIAKKVIQEEKQKTKRQEYIAQQNEKGNGNNDNMIKCGDAIEIMKTLPDNSVNLIFTDPPYAEEYIKYYGQMAEQAKRILKKGGSLITYVGHYAVPQVCEDMGQHLKFWWIIAMKHGGANVHLKGKWIYVEWKPLLWYVKESRANNNYVADFIQSEAPEKLVHKWQQGMKEAEYYIQYLTDPGDTVLDPFSGSGTTILAALKNDRRAMGIEKEQENVNIIKGRINEYFNGRGKQENNT